MNKTCIAYAAGPGDIVKTFRYWQNGRDDPHQVAITYSGQFFELCKKLNVKGVAISSNPRADSISTEQFHIENIPPVPASKGFQFHGQQIMKSYNFIQRARHHGANIFVVSDATGHWFPFSWFTHPNEIIIPTLHCVLWSNFSPLSRSRKALNLIERPFFSHRTSGILCVSEDIEKQIQFLTEKKEASTKIFHPVYRPGTFDSITPPPSSEKQFNIFFAGRLEKTKGVYDLLNIAVHMKKKNFSTIQFDLLGNGSEEKSLRQQANEQRIEDVFHIHGYCHRDKLLQLLNQAHVIIVPTTKQFHEGFNKVVAEGILAGRPVITSSACPALNQLREGIVEVPAEDVSAYEQAILQLYQNQRLYQEKRQACKKLSKKFYDLRYSWGAALEDFLLTKLHSK